MGSVPCGPSTAVLHCTHLRLRVQDRAYSMLASRAFVHQYEKYGLAVQDFETCFAQVRPQAQRRGLPACKGVLAHRACITHAVCTATQVEDIVERYRLLSWPG